MNAAQHDTVQRNISVLVTLGHKKLDDKNRGEINRKTFAFRGFEAECLAQDFLKSLDSFLHAEIQRCPDNRISNEEIYLVKPVGSQKGNCRSAAIIICPSHDLSALFNEMLSHFNLQRESFAVVE